MVTEEKPIVRMKADSMEAYVMLITPDDGGEYTIESLQKALDDRGVKYGIDEAALTELIDEKKYEQSRQTEKTVIMITILTATLIKNR